MRLSLKVAVGVMGMGVLLFGAAGTLAWWNGWLILAVMLVLGAATARAVERFDGLAQERRTAGAQAPTWDRVVVALLNLAAPAMVVLAGLEVRFGAARKVADGMSALAFLLLLPAILLAYRAMAVNAFFSSHARIQTERGHVVVADGPYASVRHPAYAAMIAVNLLTPVALGSWLALIPGVAAAGLLVWRTAREDRFLLRDLPGYAAYAARVPYRLMPGVW